MTGFATKLVPLTDKDGSRASLSINLKSLNSRFFELTCRLPYQINHLETSLAKILKNV